MEAAEVGAALVKCKIRIHHHRTAKGGIKSEQSTKSHPSHDAGHGRIKQTGNAVTDGGRNEASARLEGACSRLAASPRCNAARTSHATGRATHPLPTRSHQDTTETTACIKSSSFPLLTLGIFFLSLTLPSLYLLPLVAAFTTPTAHALLTTPCIASLHTSTPPEIPPHGHQPAPGTKITHKAADHGPQHRAG